MGGRNFIRRQHGAIGTRLYSIWKGMRSRCAAPVGTHNFRWYSSKGIKVCAEWDDYKSFYKWAMENGYDDTLTIDRIDSDGDYEPSNCRWATKKEQANNRSCTRRVSYNGETHTLSEWSEITHIKYSILNSRYWVGDRGDRLFRTPRKSSPRKAVI